MNTRIAAPRILIYEGSPGSGKTTLRYNYGKASNFVDLTIDRFTATQWVFSNLRNDKILLKTEEIENRLERNFNVCVVRCICAPQVALERALKRGDELELDLDMMKKISNLYDSYFFGVCQFARVINVYTDLYNEQQCVEKMLNELNLRQ